MTDPFVVKIAPGQTEIDLRPLLLPLLQFVACRHGCGVEERRVGEDKAGKHRSYSPTQMEDFMGRLVDRQRLAGRMACLRPEWIHDYATKTGWRTSDSYRHRQYNREYDRWRPTDAFVVHKKEGDARFPGDCWAAVKSLSAYEDRSWDEVIDSIMAHGNAVDALASVRTDDVDE